MDKYDQIRFFGGKKTLNDWKFLKISGQDSKRFLQGQLTSDLNLLNDGEFQLSCRLDRTGRLISFFYLGLKSDNYFLLIHDDLIEATVQDLEKFIIMDDVTISPIHESVVIIFDASLESKNENSLNITFSGLPGYVDVFRPVSSELNEVDDETMKLLTCLHGYPLLGINVVSGQLVNETTLNELAVSYDKGCFLGQETVAKINNNKGAGYYPVLFEYKDIPTISEFTIRGKKAGSINYIFQGKKIASAKLLREFRIFNRNEVVELNGKKIEVKILDPFLFDSKVDEELYVKGVKIFNEGKLNDAIDILERVIKINPHYADAYESLGVMYGRNGQFERAIALMDKLMEIDPESVMAHTNKSLYLMKLGKIEEAEEEKALATVKSFEKFGKESREKLDEKEAKEKEMDELNRREKMFKQVLELDKNDSIANHGLAEILYKKENFEESERILEELLGREPKRSVSYLWLAKAKISLNKKEEAKKILEKGVEVSSAQGDMMPANQMQSILNRL